MTVSPPHSSGMQSAIRQLLLDAVGLRVRLVDLIDRDNDRHLRRARVIDRFERLRHHAVVRGHHQNHDIGDFSAACAHACKRFVARRVDKHDGLSVLIDVISADMLRNAAGFLAGDIRDTDRIEQRSFTVIDVAHDGNHGRAAEQIGSLFGLFDFLHGLFFVGHSGSGSAEFAREFSGQFARPESG